MVCLNNSVRRREGEVEEEVEEREKEGGSGEVQGKMEEGRGDIFT